MIYDAFLRLCRQRNIAPSTAAVEAGISKSTVSKWKQTPDAEPSGAVLKKLSDYFGVTVAELMGEPSDSPHPVSDEDIKFALFGGSGEGTDAMYAEVKRFAAFLKAQKESHSD